MAEVIVTEVTAGLRDGTWIVTRYEVRTDTGYLAVLPACVRDACREGELIPCAVTHKRMSVDAELTHGRTHCHGWHAEKVALFADAVRGTYSAGGKRSRASVGVSRQCAHLPYAEALGLTEDQWKAQRGGAAVSCDLDLYRVD